MDKGGLGRDSSPQLYSALIQFTEDVFKKVQCFHLVVSFLKTEVMSQFKAIAFLVTFETTECLTLEVQTRY